MAKVGVVFCFPMCFRRSRLRLFGTPWHPRAFLRYCLRSHLTWEKIRVELPDAFQFASITSNISGVSLNSCTIFKPVCPTCDSNPLLVSLGDSSFTKASCQFIIHCLASVYMVHLAQCHDVALDFVSLSFQLSHASRVYTASALFLVIFRIKSRQLSFFFVLVENFSTSKLLLRFRSTSHLRSRSPFWVSSSQPLSPISTMPIVEDLSGFSIASQSSLLQTGQTHLFLFSSETQTSSSFIRFGLSRALLSPLIEVLAKKKGVAGMVLQAIVRQLQAATTS
ncbi:Uncharacterized protein Rs2_03738 [Raphanus sativus]|nr:Uncharacterized protein Rs2_03738 [Raphanus sativus]